MAIALKCGCQITDDAQFVFGKECTERNCGECRTIASIHPFTKKRFADLVFRLE